MSEREEFYGSERKGADIHSKGESRGRWLALVFLVSGAMMGFFIVSIVRMILAQ